MTFMDWSKRKEICDQKHQVDKDVCQYLSDIFKMAEAAVWHIRHEQHCQRLRVSQLRQLELVLSPQLQCTAPVLSWSVPWALATGNANEIETLGFYHVYLT